MVKKEFQEVLRNEVQGILGENYNVVSETVTKNNSEELLAIVIRSGNEVVSPVFYIDHAYEQYLGGEDLCILAENVIDVYRNSHLDGDFNIEELLKDFSKARKFLTFRLVNHEWNDDILEEVVHTDFLDLAVVYQLALPTKDGFGYVQIKHDLLNHWKVSIEDLESAIRENIYCGRVNGNARPLNTVIQEMMGKDAFDASFERVPSEEDMMWVVTNESGSYGAGSILLPEIAKRLAERLQSNLVILPSSVHEVLVIKESATGYEELLAMVRMINSTEVMPGERLSDNIYIYDRTFDKFDIVS